MIRIYLSRLLGERRWTQADLARRAGIRAATINDLYNEFAIHVSLEHLDKICEVLECDLTDLIARVPNPNPDSPALPQRRRKSRK